MQPLAIPASIWINLVLLVAGAVFVRVKLRKGAGSKRETASRVAPTNATAADL